MHGYVLVPSWDNLFKLIAAEQGNSPSTQGVPLVLRSEDLPTNDQVVSHVIQLNYLQAEEASTAFQQLIPLHPYGKILAVANGQLLIITEASQTIRSYLELARQVDAPPMAANARPRCHCRQKRGSDCASADFYRELRRADFPSKPRC